MSILFAILLFSALIFVHELGHFVAAKLSGVQVNEFAMFMGPAIFKWKRGETQYSIRCIPIGGYCAMEGEDKDTDNPRSFQKAAWWKRLIILVAGAAMNFIAGLLILVAVYAPLDTINVPEVSHIEEGCLIAGEDGIQLGDRIVSIDGEKIYIAADFNILTTIYDSEVHDLEIERNGQKILLDDFQMIKSEFPTEDGGTELRYGFSFGYKEATLGLKLEHVWNTALYYVRSVRISLGMLISGKAGLNDMAGPVGIVQQMSETAAASESTYDAFMNLLNFGALIAVNLAVMNLLPIPALDGGRVVGLVLTTTIEKIIGKKLNPKYEGYIHGVGMILLLALMAFVMFKDVFMIFKG